MYSIDYCYYYMNKIMQLLISKRTYIEQPIKIVVFTFNGNTLSIPQLLKPCERLVLPYTDNIVLEVELFCVEPE